MLLPENVASMTGGMGTGGSNSHSGDGPWKPGSPRGQMGRGSCKPRVGSAQLGDWRPVCGSPLPPAERNLGGAATGSWGPHKPGLGEPVTISGGLGSNTLTAKPRAPNLPFEACPFLPQG